jgi:hypothetical protein
MHIQSLSGLGFRSVQLDAAGDRIIAHLSKWHAEAFVSWAALQPITKFIDEREVFVPLAAKREALDKRGSIPERHTFVSQVDKLETFEKRERKEDKRGAEKRMAFGPVLNKREAFEQREPMRERTAFAQKNGAKGYKGKSAKV